MLHCRRRLVEMLIVVAAVTAVATPTPAAARFVAGHTGDEVPPPTTSRTVVPHSRERPASRRGVWPLQPRPDVVARFEPPVTRWGPGHRGVDLVGHAGQPVRTTMSGRVGFVGRVAGRGVVVVDHGATRTTYEPVLGTVDRGARVSEGDVIGRLTAGGSHCSTRACLHWGWRRGEVYLDPLRLVDAPRPVRLLPW